MPMPIMPKRLPCRLVSGMRQAAQRQDEEDAGDEIEKCARLALMIMAPQPLLLVHRQHALGDQEAAEDVDRGEDQRDEAEDARPERPGAPARGTPTASSAPTTITDEIALVTDISGVCSAGVTAQTT